MKLKLTYTGITPEFNSFTQTLIVTDIDYNNATVKFDNGKEMTFEFFNSLLKRGQIQLKYE